MCPTTETAISASMYLWEADGRANSTSILAHRWGPLLDNGKPVGYRFATNLPNPASEPNILYVTCATTS
jgi:hypothetical protein